MTDLEFARAIRRPVFPIYRMLALTILAVIAAMFLAWDIVH